jgi:hypothetical protein
MKVSVPAAIVATVVLLLLPVGLISPWLNVASIAAIIGVWVMASKTKSQEANSVRNHPASSAVVIHNNDQ